MHDTQPGTRERIIPKEQAVFWMDGHGRWCNVHGPFAHRKIIDHFNASIQKDAHGYFVAQEYAGVREKVYFRYDVTPLFAMDLLEGDPERLVLNTGRMLPLQGGNLCIRADQLYHVDGDEWVRFSERLLLKLSSRLKHANGRYAFKSGGRWLPVREFRLSSESG